MTIKDVAKKAQVSIATVSLVIHNNKRISEDTKLKVNNAIKELNYHPSRSARGLVSQKTGNIGFILTENHFLRSEPFYTQIFLGAEFEAHNHEFYILLTTVPAIAKSKIKLPRFVLEKNVDGIIVAGTVPHKLASLLDEHSLPIVYVDYYPEGKESSAVLIDNFGGGKEATEHLIQLHHRNIAFLGGDITHPSIKHRFDGFKWALDEHSIPFSSSNFIVDEADTSRESGYKAAEKLLKINPGVTAIFACNDAMAFGAMQCVKDEGYSVPQDISIVGFDDVEIARTSDPELTTIAVPKQELGCEAVRLMNRLLESKTVTSHSVTVGIELIKRNSTAVKQ
ncbi:MAG: LacI family DNA-binding transcriptional regulator [Ignavibacteriales bacterium]|nr:LacI family DNA-binding transcriptional regulator [Ignavibacteriales bacterium]